MRVNNDSFYLRMKKVFFSEVWMKSIATKCITVYVVLIKHFFKKNASKLLENLEEVLSPLLVVIGRS